MIPSIKSFQELVAMSKSRSKTNQLIENTKFNCLTEDSGQRKRYIRSEYDEKIKLPSFKKIYIAKWKKSKNAMAKIFNELDYNNNIQSSYDLTLLERVSRIQQKDVA